MLATTTAETAETLAALIEEAIAGCDECGARIILNRLRRIVPSETHPEQKDPASPTPLTDEQAKAFGQTLMPFGRHANEPYDSVPLDYLIWLADVQLAGYRQLHAYLHSPRISREIDNAD